MTATSPEPAQRGYDRMAFSPSVKRLCARETGGLLGIQAASSDKALEMLRAIRPQMPDLASDEVVQRVLGHNPEVIQRLDVSRARSQPAFLAYIPLTDKGADALVQGRFDALDPDLSHICRPGERPVAIYIWLVFAPGKFIQTLRALDSYLGKLAPSGCPLFARPATKDSGDIFLRLGFGAARLAYPHAPAGLLALAPSSGYPDLDRGTNAAEGVRIHVRVARTLDDVLKGFSVRAATYIAEQDCPFDEEFDGNDFCATHFIGEIDGEPAGCVRVRFFADFVKVERLAVRHEFRKSRLAFKLVREALGYATRKGYRRAYGHSRTDLTRFWRHFGFRPIAGHGPFIFSDVEYVELQAELAASDDRISIGADPYVLIRPEGEWDVPGPLDRSAQRDAQRRSA